MDIKAALKTAGLWGGMVSSLLFLGYFPVLVIFLFSCLSIGSIGVLVYLTYTVFKD